MKPTPKTWLRFRITLLLCLFSCLFVVVFARAYQLQVQQSHKLAALAERQYQRIVPLVPKRGILYDRKKEEMAITMEADSVFAQPGKMVNVKKAATKIGPILGKNSRTLLEKMKEHKPFVWLERGITPGQRAAIEKLNLEGVDFLKETKRFYPQGEIGSHIIGFAGVDSKGLEGVELEYDELIRGEPGYILISKDALGRTITPETAAFRHSEEGCEIILTIDKNIQYLVEKELKNAVQACSAKGGTAIVMNPKTGEILALAIQPSFDPNRFARFPPRFGRTVPSQILLSLARLSRSFSWLLPWRRKWPHRAMSFSASRGRIPWAGRSFTMTINTNGFLWGKSSRSRVISEPAR